MRGEKNQIFRTIVRDGFEDISNFCALWVYQTLKNIITSKDVNEVYKRGEKIGLFMRLDTRCFILLLLFFGGALIFFDKVQLL